LNREIILPSKLNTQARHNCLVWAIRSANVRDVVFTQ
jgi:hypothetical protein